MGNREELKPESVLSVLLQKHCIRTKLRLGSLSTILIHTFTHTLTKGCGNFLQGP